MDKPNRNKTITIKINGNEEAYIKELDKTAVETPPAQKQKPAPIVIESAAAKEEPEESFDWILPSEEVKSFEKESLFVPKPKKKSGRNNQIYQRFFVSVVMAVLIGAGLWYVVFRTITASETPTVNTAAPVSENSNENGQPTVAELSPLELVFVQGGALSNREAAEAAKAELTSEGFPGIVISDGDRFYVALFASDSLENAKAVAVNYKERGIEDVYWKEIVVTPATDVQLSAADTKVLTASVALYQQLAEASTLLVLSSGEPNAEALNNSLAELMALEVNDEHISEMVIALKGAVETAVSTESGQAAQQIQDDLLQYVTMYEQLVRP